MRSSSLQALHRLRSVGVRSTAFRAGCALVSVGNDFIGLRRSWYHIDAPSDSHHSDLPANGKAHGHASEPRLLGYGPSAQQHSNTLSPRGASHLTQGYSSQVLRRFCKRFPLWKDLSCIVSQGSQCCELLCCHLGCSQSAIENSSKRCTQTICQWR